MGHPDASWGQNFDYDDNTVLGAANYVYKGSARRTGGRPGPCLGVVPWVCPVEFLRQFLGDTKPVCEEPRRQQIISGGYVQLCIAIVVGFVFLRFQSLYFWLCTHVYTHVSSRE